MTYVRTHRDIGWVLTVQTYILMYLYIHTRIRSYSGMYITSPPPTTPVPSTDHTPLQAANGFMLIISCQQARVLYVSETVEDVLHESQDAWKGQFFYDILHPKDIQKVKAQLDCMNMEESE